MYKGGMWRGKNALLQSLDFHCCPEEGGVTQVKTLALLPQIIQLVREREAFQTEKSRSYRHFHFHSIAFGGVIPLFQLGTQGCLKYVKFNNKTTNLG